MNILVLSQYFWPESFRVNDLVSELVARGHEVTVMTGIPNYPDGDIFEDYRNNPAAFTSYAGAKVLRVWMLPRRRGALRLILNYVSFVIGSSFASVTKYRSLKFDCIFVFEPSPVTVGIPAIILSRLKGAPIVFWALDLWPESLKAVGVVSSPKLLSAIGSLVSFIYNRCDLVLGQSKGFLKNIARYCDDPKKIRYFPSWAEDVFEDSVADPAPEVAFRPDLFNIVFAGNIGEAQDMPAICDAADALRDNDNIRWIIVGDGRKFDWLSAEIKRRGLEKRMILTGRYPVERMPSFYAHANALLVSLRKDPAFELIIPGKVQSYLLAGISILGMIDGEGATVLREARAGIVCPAGDSKKLAEAAQTLANYTHEERLLMGLNGKRYAQREFDRKKLIDKLETMFARVIEENKSRKRTAL